MFSDIQTRTGFVLDEGFCVDTLPPSAAELAALRSLSGGKQLIADVMGSS